MLKLNNIEVTYSDVILVLKGVSLEVGSKKLFPFSVPTVQEKVPRSKLFQVF